jgi:hypothetical protein
MTLETTVKLPSLTKPLPSPIYWINISQIGTVTNFSDRLIIRMADGSSLALQGTEAHDLWQRLQKSGRGFTCNA